MAAMPLLEIHVGFWARAGELRKSLLARGLKSGIADALIAQTCIDHRVSLLTLDRDFRHYVRFGGLRIES
jgi:predicted nucleic acid-binding protein